MPRIDNDIKLDFKDVLLRPKRSTLASRADVHLHREITFRNSKRHYKGVPIMASNMDTVDLWRIEGDGGLDITGMETSLNCQAGSSFFAPKFGPKTAQPMRRIEPGSTLVSISGDCSSTFEMALALSKQDLFTCIHKHYKVEQWAEFAAKHPNVLPQVAVSAGMSSEDFEKLGKIIAAVPNVQFICLDVANGYTEKFVAFVRQVRGAFPNHTIIAGNVVTGEMVEELILSGADIVKVGIGPGSVCTTRKKTGVGYPQLSAVLECADAANGLKGHIVSDGGCSNPGDLAKAFGAGAHFVMIGGMLAGHDQSGGETIERDGQKYKLFYGMSSSTAMHKHSGSVAEYRASEGKTVTVPYRGDVDHTVMDILGGIRSACTYTGALKLKEMSKRATFIRVTQQANEMFTGLEMPAASERKK